MTVRCHSLSPVVTCCAIRCHSLSLVVSFVVIRRHLLPLVVTRCIPHLPLFFYLWPKFLPPPPPNIILHLFIFKFFIVTKILDKIFETNSNFHMKQRTAEKIQFLFFSIFASVNKIFI